MQLWLSGSLFAKFSDLLWLLLEMLHREASQSAIQRYEGTPRNPWQWSIWRSSSPWPQDTEQSSSVRDVEWLVILPTSIDHWIPLCTCLEHRVSYDLKNVLIVIHARSQSQGIPRKNSPSKNAIWKLQCLVRSPSSNLSTIYTAWRIWKPSR